MIARRWILIPMATALLTAAGYAGGTAPAAQPELGMRDPALARSDYIENCGGCHGVTGSTAPAMVPELRGRVGWFLCTAETRDYLLRLPNVAHSRVRDDEQLAELMNYVVYVIGQPNIPAQARPFTADDVARARPQALTSVNLTKERARNVAIAMKQCGAPASLRDFYDGQTVR